jgi:SagB-type dehydrogenase family enzyme
MRAIRLLAMLLIALPAGDLAFGRPSSERRLPEPDVSGGAPVMTVLRGRHSIRELAARGLTDAELGQLLWAAQGITNGHRTAPSAGALYPLTVRVIDARGVWRYVPDDHVLVRENTVDVRTDLATAAHRQPVVREAPVTLVITAETAITAAKYGPRAERFAALEAGHVAQNVMLAATSLDLAGVPIGAFVDDTVRRILALPGDVTPLYLIPIGHRP